MEVFDKGDQFKVKSTGALKTVWKVSVAYIDPEGNAFMAEDVEQIRCLHSNAKKLAEFEDVWDCPDGCGIIFGRDDGFHAFTSDLL